MITFFSKLLYGVRCVYNLKVCLIKEAPLVPTYEEFGPFSFRGVRIHASYHIIESIRALDCEPVSTEDTGQAPHPPTATRGGQWRATPPCSQQTWHPAYLCRGWWRPACCRPQIVLGSLFDVTRYQWPVNKLVISDRRHSISNRQKGQVRAIHHA